MNARLFSWLGLGRFRGLKQYNKAKSKTDDQGDPSDVDPKN